VKLEPASRALLDPINALLKQSSPEKQIIWNQREAFPVHPKPRREYVGFTKHKTSFEGAVVMFVEKCQAESIDGSGNCNWIEDVTNGLCEIYCCNGGWCLDKERAATCCLIEQIEAIEEAIETLACRRTCTALPSSVNFQIKLIYLLTHIFFVQTDYLKNVPTDCSSLMCFRPSILLFKRLMSTKPADWKLHIEPFLEVMIMEQYATVSNCSKDAFSPATFDAIALDTLVRWTCCPLKLESRLHLIGLAALLGCARADVAIRLANSSASSAIKAGTGTRENPKQLRDSQPELESLDFPALRARLDQEGVIYCSMGLPSRDALAAGVKFNRLLQAIGAAVPGCETVAVAVVDPETNKAKPSYTTDIDTDIVNGLLHQPEWKRFTGSPEMKKVYEGEALRRFTEGLFDEQCVRLLESTFVRAKSPGEDTYPHYDYSHIASSTTVMGRHRYQDGGSSNVELKCTQSNCKQGKRAASELLTCALCDRVVHTKCLSSRPKASVIRAMQLDKDSVGHQEFHCSICAQGPHNIWTVWAPLGDAPMHHSTLIVVPGTHRLGGVPCAIEEKDLLPAGFDPVACRDWHAPSDMRAGGFIVFNILTIHAATRNTLGTYRTSIDVRFAGRFSPPVSPSAATSSTSSLPLDSSSSSSNSMQNATRATRNNTPAYGGSRRSVENNYPPPTGGTQAYSRGKETLVSNCKLLGVQIRPEAGGNYGRGLMATRNFKEGELIGPFFGKFVLPEEFEEIIAGVDPTRLSDDEEDYTIAASAGSFRCISIPPQESGASYLLASEQCPMTFVNHGDHENQRNATIAVSEYRLEPAEDHNSLEHAVIRATRRITVGEEILVDYNFSAQMWSRIRGLTRTANKQQQLATSADGARGQCVQVSVCAVCVMC
jgi:ectoine hydroxylase-related dioxygenase (phytanoyl-CoA dioxygenase family)